MMAENRLLDEECVEAFTVLFPAGFNDPVIFHELAPDGWERSPLRLVFHPSIERIYEESVRIHKNMETLFKSDAPRSPAPTMDEIKASHVETPLEPQREIAELVAMCVWDIFSDNHDVLAPDGRVVDLGSFRGSAGFIADLLNQANTGKGYSYIDFYMGTIWVSGRADLTVVYEMIFRQLNKHGFDWAYHFPRLALVDMRPLLDSIKPEEKEWENYDPSEAMQKQQEEEEKHRQTEELRASLDAAHAEAVENAQNAPPPRTVVAYQHVFESWPRGWPPVLGVD